MSRFHTIALAVALTIGAAGAAAAQSASTPAPDSAPPAAHQHRGQGMRHGRRAHGALFRGVQLSQAQHSQLQAIHQKYRAQAKSIREAMRPALEEARAARQRGDSAAARAAWERTKDQRAQLRALRERQLGEVRGMLTPEQRTRFDQNARTMRERMRQHRAHRAQGAGAS